jgi:mannose/fructose/N-acetylgalactosamine-specific phosphotransferase system component IIB
MIALVSSKEIKINRIIIVNSEVDSNSLFGISLVEEIINNLAMTPYNIICIVDMTYEPKCTQHSAE